MKRLIPLLVFTLWPPFSTATLDLPLEAFQPPATTATGRHQLQVTTEGLTLITLEAENARLSEIAADLASRLRLNIVVGPGLAAERLTLNLFQFPFESAIGALAPRAYVDYEVRRGQEPSAREVFLTSADEPEPEARGAMQGVLISGHTEDVAGAADDPLKLAYEDNRLTLFSREQPLAVVLMAIGETLNVPVDLESDALEPLDTDFRGVPIEDAILRLSPNLRLHVRVDVFRGARVIRRIVLARSSA